MSKFCKLIIIILCLSQIHCRDFQSREASTTAIYPAIKDFSRADENEAWLITEKGKAFHLFNNGQPNQEVKFEAKITQVYFLNANEGWVLDAKGQIWATNNNGKDWVKRALLTDETLPELISNQLVFADNQVGWLIGSFNIWLTEDGGNSWAMVYPTEKFDYDTLRAQPMRLFTVNSDVAWLGLTNSKVLMTVNRGKSWEAASIPKKYDIHGLYAFSAEECLVAGWNAGGLYHTTDGGKDWRQVLETKVSENLGIDSVSFVDRKNGWAAGRNFVTNLDKPETNTKVLLKTIDGGKNWAKIEIGFQEQGFTEVNFINEKNGWLVGDKTVYNTKNEGISWQKIFIIEDDKKSNK